MRMHRLIRPLVLALMLLSIPALSFGGVAISVSIGPPPIPVYTQPLCPGPGYMWTPGYWAWGDDGYYWVPGTWVMAPQPGFLWTPGYWGWAGGVYLWHGGYWGPHVGFYGGINYGFGYTGTGFYGGEWRGRNFYYNRSVNNVTNITNVYNKTVIVNNNTHVSYNGGNGGVRAEPTPQQRQWQNERHIEPTHNQMEHQQLASRNQELRASTNHGRPAIAATQKPTEFSGRGIVGARAAGGPVNREALTATPKNMPAPRNEARPNEGTARGANVPRPPSANNERGNTTAAGSPHNVPRPNNAPRAEANGNAPRENNAGSRNVPRPPNATSNNRETTARPAETARPAPTAHSSATARESGPRESSSPRPSATHESAPPSHASASHQSAPASHASTPHESSPHASAPARSAPAPRGESHGGGEKPSGEKPKR